jgi:hypothetical protein
MSSSEAPPFISPRPTLQEPTEPPLEELLSSSLLDQKVLRDELVVERATRDAYASELSSVVTQNVGLMNEVNRLCEALAQHSVKTEDPSLLPKALAQQRQQLQLVSPSLALPSPSRFSEEPAAVIARCLARLKELRRREISLQHDIAGARTLLSVARAAFRFRLTRSAFPLPLVPQSILAERPSPPC